MEASPRGARTQGRGPGPRGREEGHTGWTPGREGRKGGREAGPPPTPHPKHRNVFRASALMASGAMNFTIVGGYLGEIV